MFVVLFPLRHLMTLTTCRCREDGLSFPYRICYTPVWVLSISLYQTLGDEFFILGVLH